MKRPPGRRQQKAVGRVQGLSVPSRELEDGPTGGCEGRHHSRGVVPACRVHCDEPDVAGSGGGTVLQQARAAEQWIKEGKQAVKMTRLSCHRFRSNEVRLWLTIIAYNSWATFGATGAATENRDLSLTILQQRLVKTGGRLRKHARYYWLLLAETISAIVCQYVRADRWTAASVGIAPAAAPKKTGFRDPQVWRVCAEKAGSGCFPSETVVRTRKAAVEGVGFCLTVENSEPRDPLDGKWVWSTFRERSLFQLA